MKRLGTVGQCQAQAAASPPVQQHPLRPSPTKPTRRTWHDRIVLLAYVDESYSTGWDRYWIAALVCPEHVLGPLSSALDDVVGKAADSYSGIGSDAELHGHALLHGKEDWRPIAPMVRSRIGVYNDAFSAIGSYDVQIMIRGVHVPRLIQRYVYPHHPHTVVLQHLLESLDVYAANHDQSALVIADEVDRAHEYRRDLWRYHRESTPGWKARRLTNIVDTIHFAPSHASRLVQAADLIAYLHGRMTSGADRDERAVRANERLWSRIKPRVHHCDWWRP